MNEQSTNRTSLKEQINWSMLIPGTIIMVITLIFALVFGDRAYNSLESALNWEMGHFKWVWVLCVIAVVGFMLFLIFSKYGDIVIGGKDAKPSMSTFTWLALTLTGGIAVGICFYGVTGPLTYFLNPPTFLGIEGGTAEAVIPALTYTYLNWGLGPYALLTAAGLMLAFAFYNMKREFRPGSMLYPVFGKKGEKTVGWIVDMSLFLMLVIGCTNSGLSAIQLSAGIRNTFGIDISIFAIVVLYGIIGTLVVTNKKAHNLMGTISNVNVYIYLIMLGVVLLFGPTNRLLCTLFESVGDYLSNFLKMTTFADVARQTGWQDTETMFYYSWNLGPCLMASLFYALLAKGRTIRQFCVVQFILPCVLIFCWFSVFGGTSIFQYLAGNTHIADILAAEGNGVATFAFLETLPLSGITKIVYLVMTFLTFLTYEDSSLFAFPKFLIKGDRASGDSERPPIVLIIGKAVLDVVLCIAILNIGGSGALSVCTIIVTLPVGIILLLSMIGFVKGIANRKKYDATYITECITDGNWSEEDARNADPSVLETAYAELKQ